jgi:hypothetical protein
VNLFDLIRRRRCRCPRLSISKVKRKKVTAKKKKFFSLREKFEIKYYKNVLNQMQLELSGYIVDLRCAIYNNTYVFLYEI